MERRMTKTKGQGESGKSDTSAGRLVVPVLLLAAFGPYVLPGSGVRTEQIAVYLLAVTAVVLNVGISRLPAALLSLVAPWSVYVCWGVVGALIPTRDLTTWGSGSFWAGLDRALLPLAVVIAGAAAWSLGCNPRLLLRRASVWIVALMCVNALAAMLTFLAGVSWNAWWSSTDESNAARSAVSGRFTGLLNAPAEAGTLYGIAMLCAIYLWGDRPVRLMATVGFLAAAGTLTVSKVFLVGALPVVAWQLVRLNGSRAMRVLAFLIFVFAGWIALTVGILPEWTGQAHLLRQIPGQSGSVLSELTANRYGATSTLLPVLLAVLGGPWSTGYGVTGLAVSYDALWIEALVTAGVFGVAVLLWWAVVVFRLWHDLRVGSEKFLFGGILILLAGASPGLPVLTANRVATVVWILLTLLALLVEQQGKERTGD